MHGTQPEFIDVNPAQLEDLLGRAEQSLDPADYDLIQAICHSYTHLVELVEDRGTSIKRLHQLLFGHRTEKTTHIIGDPAQEADASTSEPTSSVADSTGNDEAHDETSGDEVKPKPGHGRNAADAYEGGEQIQVAHATLSAGDPCPECEKGTLYDCTPGVIVRIVGRAPLHARVYRLEKLRCGLCGEVFTAQTPPEVGERKYDATAASMIALLRYGSGLPFNRLEGLQRNLRIPLPASTQWEIVEAYSRTLMPIWRELIVRAAQGEVLHHDDTTVKILDLMNQRAGRSDEAAPEHGERRGLYTSGVVSLKGDHRVALFFSGRKHAGENLVEVLKERAEELSRPIQMCDASSRNMPVELKTIVANCLAHARRNFVQIHDRFPEECEYVLRAFELVYANDAKAREEALSAGERLALHQKQSGPKMAELREWLDEQPDQRKVEPNSALGGAMGYLRKHWEKLTLFLREAGAPLDNNICERALKRAILHRKNSLFYKSRNGASVGDMYMSLIHSCELNGVNPLDYLVELGHHAAEVASDATRWMPWNYQATLGAPREA